MKLLLDTHIFIWWADDPEKLSPAALSALEDEANELLLSVASVWEMQIKIQLGKLKLSLPLKEMVKNQQETAAQRLSSSPWERRTDSEENPATERTRLTQ